MIQIYKSKDLEKYAKEFHEMKKNEELKIQEFISKQIYCPRNIINDYKDEDVNDYESDEEFDDEDDNMTDYEEVEEYEFRSSGNKNIIIV